MEEKSIREEIFEEHLGAELADKQKKLKEAMPMIRWATETMISQAEYIMAAESIDEVRRDSVKLVAWSLERMAALERLIEETGAPVDPNRIGDELEEEEYNARPETPTTNMVYQIAYYWGLAVDNEVIALALGKALGPGTLLGLGVQAVRDAARERGENN